ncbi:MAG: aminotransferase class I/II-fold pyridoxal phosphate-dependent enzyme [Pseudomonadota bacterium]
MVWLAARNRQIDTENAFRVGPLIAAVEARGQSVVKLNFGEPDFPLPVDIREAIKAALDAGATRYCDPQGTLSLRTAIAEHAGCRRGFEIDPACVVVFPGGKPAIGLSQQVYCDPGDEVIYPSPGFPIYESFIRYVGAVPVPLHLNAETGFSVDPDALEALITPRTRMVFLNFPSNPTGGVASRAHLEALAAVIEAKCGPDVRVFSDEIYEDILFDGAEHASIASLPSLRSRTVIASGFSKTFAWTGGRVGYAILPNAEEAACFRQLNINYFSCVPAYNQAAAEVALQAPAVWEAVAAMTRTFEGRRDTVLAALDSVPGMHAETPGGAFYVFPEISGVCDALDLVGYHAALPEPLRAATAPASLFQLFALDVHGVAVLDRRAFGKIGSEGMAFLRLSIAASDAELLEGVARLRNAATDREGLNRFLDAGKWQAMV